MNARKRTGWYKCVQGCIIYEFCSMQYLMHKQLNLSMQEIRRSKVLPQIEKTCISVINNPKRVT